MFRAAMCPSSADTTVHLHTIQSSIQNNKYQVLHKLSCISWWWVHSFSKHVEIDKYKFTEKTNYAPSWFYLRDYKEMHTQQNITELVKYIICINSKYTGIAEIFEIAVRTNCWANKSKAALILPNPKQHLYYLIKSSTYIT
jgi:hypothetical protein